MRQVDAATGAGLAITLALVLLALLAPWVAPYDPYATDPARALRAPSPAHPFGTGVFGEDILSRVIWGARPDLLIAAGAVGIALVLGGALGAVAGFAGGLADEGLMRAMDVLQAFPNFNAGASRSPSGRWRRITRRRAGARRRASCPPGPPPGSAGVSCRTGGFR